MSSNTEIVKDPVPDTGHKVSNWAGLIASISFLIGVVAWHALKGNPYQDGIMITIVASFCISLLTFVIGLAVSKTVEEGLRQEAQIYLIIIVGVLVVLLFAAVGHFLHRIIN